MHVAMMVLKPRGGLLAATAVTYVIADLAKQYVVMVRIVYLVTKQFILICDVFDKIKREEVFYLL